MLIIDNSKELTHTAAFDSGHQLFQRLSAKNSNAPKQRSCITEMTTNKEPPIAEKVYFNDTMGNIIGLAGLQGSSNRDPLQRKSNGSSRATDKSKDDQDCANASKGIGHHLGLEIGELQFKNEDDDHDDMEFEEDAAQEFVSGSERNLPKSLYQDRRSNLE